MRIIVCTLFCLYSLASFSQKRDYTWLAGYDSEGGYSAGFDYWFGISKFDFGQQPVQLSYDSLGINFKGANCAISDETGNLQFYTNGITVRNFHDEIIVDSLHNGFFLNYVAGWYDGGNPNDAIMIILPNPRFDGYYDILYGFKDTTPVSWNVRVRHLMRTQINMHANLGDGEVAYKDRIFNSIPANNCLAAVRHANGRDWWLLTMKEASKCYQVFLYDGSDSIKAMPLECATDAFIAGLGQTCTHRFSPDGTKMMTTLNEEGGTCFYDFDRCTGTLTFLDKHIFPEKTDSAGTGYAFTGCEFSPSGRYAYVLGSKRIYQFDMYANPISGSKQNIAYYYPYQSPAPVTYNLAQLGPDGKIYISSRNTTYYMAVINNPDEAGAGCNFQDTVKTPSFIDGLPYYPNYRLGASPNSPCDTITGVKEIAEKERLLKIFPNPTVDVVTIDYGYTDWSKGEATMEITNNLGQVVQSQTLPMYSGFQKLHVGDYTSGSYTVYIKRKNTVVATGKLLRE